MASSSHYPIQELLERYGVEPERAKFASMNELRHWPLADLKGVFSKIKRQPHNFCPFEDTAEFQRSWRPRTELQSALQGLWPTVFKAFPRWISASRNMMQNAAESKAALCINARGQFALRKSGYVAVSHAWIEGLQQDKVHRAVASDRIDLIFKVLGKAQVEAEWLWLDVLAIPGGGGATENLENDLLKIRIINTLADVYMNADAVIIFDAMAWHLQTTDPLQLAAVMVCGAWSSRIWTFQEVKLAKKALIINGLYHAVSWAVITSRLKEAESRDFNRFHGLWLTFAIMGRDEAVTTCVRDVSSACQYRATGHDVDYARAFFPLFGLEWKLGATREEGMQQLYFSQIRDATRMIFSYGHPRLKIRPAWAPTYINGLEKITTDAMAVENRGIRGKVYAAQINEIAKRFKRFGKNVWTVKIRGTEVQFVLAPGESEETVQNLESSIKRGRAYMLSHDAAVKFPNMEFARAVILVDKAETVEHDGFEAAVHCTALVVSPTIYEDEEVSILLRHGSPLDGGLENELHYMWYRQTEESTPASAALQEAESRLHFAVRKEDLSLIKDLLEQEECPVELFNVQGWTPLHVAAARGHTKALEMLIPYSKKNIDVPGQRLNKDSPLGLAAQNDKSEAITLLANAGANVHARNDSKYTPLMVAALEGCAEAVDTLLRLGANPHDSTNTESALLVTCQRTNDAQSRRRIVESLLQAGADANGFDNVFGWRPLHKAVEWAEEDVIRLLMERNPDVNVRLKSKPDRSPLFIAVEKNRRNIVNLLLDAGADRNAVFTEGWTLLHLAARCGDFEILRMLCAESSVLDAPLEKGGFRALHIAVSLQHKIHVKILLEAGADAHATNHTGVTPLGLAENSGLESMADLLRHHFGNQSS